MIATLTHTFYNYVQHCVSYLCAVAIPVGPPATANLATRVNTSAQCLFCTPAFREKQQILKGQYLGLYLDYSPIRPGHLLIIPNAHRKVATELSANEAAELPEMLSEAQAYFESCRGTSEYLVLQKNGKKAGQTVPHVHFHIIPMSANSRLEKIKVVAIVFFKIMLGSWSMSAKQFDHDFQQAQEFFSHRHRLTSSSSLSPPPVLLRAQSR